MITGAVFVPSTPLLVGAVVAGAAAGELDGIREAAVRSLVAALETAPDRVVVVGAGTVTETHRDGWGSLRGFGVAYDVALDPASAPAATGRWLPLSLTVGAWLLQHVGWAGERTAVEVDASAADDELDEIGHGIDGDGRALLLVVADGSAARTEKAPASLHPGAEAFDARVEELLAGGDPELLRSLDRAEALAVTAAGRPAWRVAATALSGTTYAAEVAAADAPYGVGYVVARWQR